MSPRPNAGRHRRDPLGGGRRQRDLVGRAAEALGVRRRAGAARSFCAAREVRRVAALDRLPLDLVARGLRRAPRHRPVAARVEERRPLEDRELGAQAHAAPSSRSPTSTSSPSSGSGDVGSARDHRGGDHDLHARRRQPVAGRVLGRRSARSRSSSASTDAATGACGASSPTSQASRASPRYSSLELARRASATTAVWRYVVDAARAAGRVPATAARARARRRSARRPPPAARSAVPRRTRSARGRARPGARSASRRGSRPRGLPYGASLAIRMRPGGTSEKSAMKSATVHQDVS